MNVVDATALPMLDGFTGNFNTTSYSPLRNNLPLDEMNKVTASSKGKSEKYSLLSSWYILIYRKLYIAAYRLHVSITNGFAFLEEYSWDACNEGTTLIATVERYRKRTGCYPKKKLADKIYCNRANRKPLKELRIDLVAKPLRRPSKAME